MAEAFFNKLSKKNCATSAGINKYNFERHVTVANVDANVVEVMAEKGIDVSRNKIKMASRKMVEDADLVVAIMAKERAKRDLPKYITASPKFRLWGVENTNYSVKSMHAVQSEKRDKIFVLVNKLVGEIG